MDEPGDASVFNSNCQLTGSSGTNSDPSAPCYAASGVQEDPCACIANPGGPVVLQLSGSNAVVPLGSSSYVNIRKKAACAGSSIGTCCDTNGADQGCTDNVTSADCSGVDKVWTDQGKCEDVVCGCIPECTGRACGDDGCGGSCGTCDDGIACTIDACGSDSNCSFTPNHVACVNNTICDGYEFCSLETGCVPGNPLVCDDGLYCNGSETCDPASGCLAGINPCADNETCDEAGDVCVPNAIPTVSQWGLVVLTILLLVAAKVQFGRASRAL